MLPSRVCRFNTKTTIEGLSWQRPLGRSNTLTALGPSIEWITHVTENDNGHLPNLPSTIVDASFSIIAAALQISDKTALLVARTESVFLASLHKTPLW